MTGLERAYGYPCTNCSKGGFLRAVQRSATCIVLIPGPDSFAGMASPLLGIAGVNSLLFASYVYSKRIVSPFPQLSLYEIAIAGGMAGAANAILASPGLLFYACASPTQSSEPSTIQSRCSKFACKANMAPPQTKD